MASNGSVQYYVFMYRGIQYALTVMHILEIVQVSEWLPFHGALSGCLGNIVHRNTLLPVLDPTVLGTTLPSDPAKPETIIVVKHEETVFGLAIDRHLAVVPLDANGKTAVNGSHATNGVAEAAPSKPFVEGVRGYRNNTLITFSVAAISEAVQQVFGEQTVIADDSEAERTSGMLAAEAVRHSFMCARIEDVVFAIPIERVMEVIEDYDVTPLFKVTPCLRGLINLRGQVLATIDISQEMGFAPRRLDEHNQFIVLQGDGTELALCIDKVLGIQQLPQARIQKADTVLSGDITRYVHGILETDQGTIMILSVPDIFAAPQLQPYQRQDV
jgi:purine-binding chemotaxis protein CheW